MSPRSIRRAAERKALKLARKAERALQNGIPGPHSNNSAYHNEDFAAPSRSVSFAQTTANRANAQFSTGPKTTEGKAHSSLNALKTGLTGRTVLLPSDDVAAYQSHINRFLAEFNPSGDKESDLVLRLADVSWRLLRIPVLESSLLALGRIRFQDLFEDHPPELRASLIDAHTLIEFRKDFNNLSIQESRLLRQFEKIRAEVRDAQSRRRAAETEAPAKSPAPSQPSAEIGFEFSSVPPQAQTVAWANLNFYSDSQSSLACEPACLPNPQYALAEPDLCSIP
jgi:hypothetical protein